MERASEFLVHGCCGALLACLTAVSSTLFGPGFNWPFVAVCGGLGFVLGGFVGQRGLQFLTDVFWRP